MAWRGHDPYGNSLRERGFSKRARRKGLFDYRENGYLVYYFTNMISLLYI